MDGPPQAAWETPGRSLFSRHTLATLPPARIPLPRLSAHSSLWSLTSTVTLATTGLVPTLSLLVLPYSPCTPAHTRDLIAPPPPPLTLSGHAAFCLHKVSLLQQEVPLNPSLVPSPAPHCRHC